MAKLPTPNTSSSKKNYVAMGIITFIILFLMNYIGNEESDRLSRSLLTALAGVAGLLLGLYLYNRFKNEPPMGFD